MNPQFFSIIFYNQVSIMPLFPNTNTKINQRAIAKINNNAVVVLASFILQYLYTQNLRSLKDGRETPDFQRCWTPKTARPINRAFKFGWSLKVKTISS